MQLTDNMLSCSRAKKRPRSAFTLVETMVALGIFVAAAASILTGVQTLQRVQVSHLTQANAQIIARSIAAQMVEKGSARLNKLIAGSKSNPRYAEQVVIPTSESLMRGFDSTQASQTQLTTFSLSNGDNTSFPPVGSPAGTLPATINVAGQLRRRPGGGGTSWNPADLSRNPSADLRAITLVINRIQLNVQNHATTALANPNLFSVTVTLTYTTALGDSRTVTSTSVLGDV